MASPYKNEHEGKGFPQICFHMESPYNSILKNLVILNSHKKSLIGPNNLKICILA